MLILPDHQLRCFPGWEGDLKEESQSQVKEAVHGSDRKWLVALGTAQAMKGSAACSTSLMQGGNRVAFSRQTGSTELYV